MAVPSQSIDDHEDQLIKGCRRYMVAQRGRCESGQAGQERLVGKEAAGEDEDGYRQQEVD